MHTSPEHAELVKSKVERINEILGQGEDGLPPIRVSCGVAYGNSDQDVERIFKVADGALYNVKAAGGCDCRIGE